MPADAGPGLVQCAAEVAVQYAAHFADRPDGYGGAVVYTGSARTGLDAEQRWHLVAYWTRARSVVVVVDGEVSDG